MTPLLRLQCFKSAWLYAFLHDGLKFPVNYQRLESASLVNNNDVQWTLGAILYKTRFLPLRFVQRLVDRHSRSTFVFIEPSIKWRAPCIIDSLVANRERSSLCWRWSSLCWSWSSIDKSSGHRFVRSSSVGTVCIRQDPTATSVIVINY